MRKLVVLKLDGGLESGVQATLEIGSEGDRPEDEVVGQLPSKVELISTIKQWRSNFRDFYRSQTEAIRAVKAGKVAIDGFIIQKFPDCKQSAEELTQRLNEWLLSESFRPIRETWLRNKLGENDEVRVLIRTSNLQLRQLPWHLWDLLDYKKYPYIETALSAREAKPVVVKKVPTYRHKVKILAILGDSVGINIEKDRQLLNNLPDAEVTFLIEPNRQSINDHFWNQSWDILFFAGHSKTEEEHGRLYINKTDSLTIDELKYALRNAAAKGLQLAIFNSCDGLGLAYELEDLQIPHMIVMRAPVPDQVAQEFLKYFLTAFATEGKSLYQAQREARLKLHGLEDNHPCASWLPVICQNPSIMPPLWLDLGRRPTQICPYRGLFTFREEDAPFFFGREDFTKTLKEAVEQQPLVTVIGSSGSGKSSAVFAGLIPCLRKSENWCIVSFRPSNRPLHALAAALINQLEPKTSRAERIQQIRNLTNDFLENENSLQDVVEDIVWKNPGKRLLLIVDQFEELYNPRQDQQERSCFVNRLLATINDSPNFTLLITLRADFFGQVITSFGDALQKRDLILQPPMSEKELRAAIQKPAALLGVTIEERLCDRIIAEVIDNPGNLPLTEFALTQLWAQQTNAKLTNAAFDEIGGVKSALASYAEQVYNRLTKEEKERAQKIFVQLFHPNDGTVYTRRIATRAEVGDDNWNLVSRLANERLVVSNFNKDTDEQTAEIVHETLICGWNRLRQWLEIDHAFRTWQERLRGVMRQWEDSGREDDALLTGALLSKAEGWLQERPLEISQRERNFIQWSLELRDKHQADKIRLQRRAILWLFGGLVIAIIAAGVAVFQWQRSEKMRRISEIQKSTVNAFTALRQFESGEEIEGLLLAMKAGYELYPSKKDITKKNLPVGRYISTTPLFALEEILENIRQGNQLGVPVDGAINSVSFSSDRKLLATGSKNGKVRLWDLQGNQLTEFPHQEEVTSMSFSPDGRLLATASSNIARIWDLKEKKLLKQLEHTRYWIYSVKFSPDGKLLATASADHTAKLWDWQKSKVLREFQHKYSVGGVSFSPDGKLLATASDDGTVKLWHLNKQFNLKTQPLLELKHLDGLGKFENVKNVSFSIDGKLLATASLQGTVRLWDLKGHQLSKFKHKGWVHSISFSPNGKHLATASRDGTAKIWDLEGNLLTEYKHQDEVNSVDFSPDGNLLATASTKVKLWDLQNKHLPEYEHDSNWVNNVNFSPDGKLLVTASGDYKNKPTKLWDLQGKLKKEFQHQGEVVIADFSPDGKLLVTASSQRKNAELWDLQGNLLASFQHKDEVWGVSFSPDGKLLATASNDNTAGLWDLKGNKLREFKHSDNVWWVSFSPDSKLLATASKDGIARLWDLQGNLLAEFKHSKPVWGVAFSPNGKFLATASADNTAKLWDLQQKKLLREFPHRGLVTNVTFSPNGELLATISNDYTARLWDLEGNQLAEFNHGGMGRKVSFSPDGKLLATAGGNSTVKLWRVEGLNELMIRGCKSLHDYLKNPNNNVDEKVRNLCNRMEVRLGEASEIQYSSAKKDFIAQPNP